MFIDTHAHLFFENYATDLHDVIEKAFYDGVTRIIVPGTDLKTSEKAIELAQKYRGIYASVGVHPHDTKDWKSSDIKLFEQLLTEKKVIAVGEIGLDYYYDYSPKEKQIKAFREQLDLAIEKNKPVIIHNREANSDTMQISREYSLLGMKAQYHCYAGTLEEAKELISLGHYISFPGNLTFKTTEHIREMVKVLGLESLLLETDSPFMTPVPHRGKRNEPAYLVLIAQKLAEIFECSIETVGEITTHNAEKLFKLLEINEPNYVYKLGNNLYINITNRCNSKCYFCHREDIPFLGGYDLSMSKSAEANSNVYIEKIGNPLDYDEIVFCGYGEPTLRWEVVKEIAKYIKSKGGKTRLDTNGHGNYLNKRDITPELKDIFDLVSVSLNAENKELYSKIMQIAPEFFDETINFAKLAKQYTNVVLTAVDLPEIDAKIVEDFVVNSLGFDFKLRYYYR